MSECIHYIKKTKKCRLYGTECIYPSDCADRQKTKDEPAESDKHYKAAPVLEYAKKIGCPVVGIAGGKGNGKTYDLIRGFLKIRCDSGEILRYLRRYRESISPKALQSLCKPQRQNLINYSKGKYNDFQYYQNRFFMVHRNESGDITVKDNKPFMVCSALNSVEASTGADEGLCSAVFYDEIFSREKELPDEFYQTMIFYSNCTRNRQQYCPLILVGNTVTRNCILITNFGIDLYSCEKGQISVVKNSKKEPTIVFEYCDEVQVMKEAAESFYSRFENDRIKMIYKGDWTVSNYPMLPYQTLQEALELVCIKIITPAETALRFRFMKRNNQIFGYVCKMQEDDEKYICTMINKTYLYKQPRVYNFLPAKGIFKQFSRLIYTKNVYFESMETGEYFRDFLKNLTGANQLINVYK